MAFAKLRCFHGFARYCYIKNCIKRFETLNAFFAKFIMHFIADGLQNLSILFILAVLDFNSRSRLEQVRSKTNEKKYNVGFSKTWSSKPIKTKKDNSYLK